MLIKDKVIEIFCMRDDFCKFFDAMTAKDTLKPIGKRKYHRSATILKTEVMLIMNLFYNLGYRCFKHFYLEKECKHLRHLFPNVVSYNSLVKLERDVAIPIPLTLFIKKVLLGKCSIGWFFGFNLHLIYNEKGELLNFIITSENVYDRKPLEYNVFSVFMYGKLIGDKGYISGKLFQRLFVDGIQLITRLKSNMKGVIMNVHDKLQRRKIAIIETLNDELRTEEHCTSGALQT